MPTLHAFVISWPGRIDSAVHIEAQVRGVADVVTVLHSHRDGSAPPPAGWTVVPDEDYYGAKFSRCLALQQGDVMLQLHADCRCDDWAGLVRRCREVHAQVPRLGVWSPETDYTPYPTDEVVIGGDTGQELVPVAHTDSIVWSLSAPVLARLRELDLSATPLGWGIDWAAISTSVANGLLVLRDRAVHVSHPRGSGYPRPEAEAQMQAFLAQLSPGEQVARRLLESHLLHRRRMLGRPASGL